MAFKKHHLNLVVIGELDAGKSTTIGHLFHKLGRVDVNTIQKNEGFANQIGMASFKYAWVFDKMRAERERGLTISNSMSQCAYYETSKYEISVIDTPGHKAFMKNMITGISQGDCALLIVSAPQREFTQSMSAEGFLMDIIVIAYTFGIKQLVIGVNKMDEHSVNYEQQKYQMVVDEMTVYLKKVGYKADQIKFVPISGWIGDNLIDKSPKMQWYQGPTILEAIDQFAVPIRPIDKPLRITLQVKQFIRGVGTVLVGKVQSGVLQQGMNLLINPLNQQSIARSIEKHHVQMNQVIAGDKIGIATNGNIMIKDQIKSGFVLSDPANDPARQCISFIAQMIILNCPNEIKNGYIPVIYCHCAHIPCKFERILAKVDKRTGKTLKENPETIQAGDAALVKIVPMKPMCVEAFADYPNLGRFVVRDSKRIVAVGIIKQVEKQQQDIQQQ